jgi:hypothetical protein
MERPALDIEDNYVTYADNEEYYKQLYANK